ncbi:hypothetical protein K469DRAFT_111269 [Zopfia rhizophila CBS 207.26]|uniref:Uncharacterized protein n=1 Tax=Zopfia rhizophila CBS 207.26 TaxID=1314779 RepID=A0A6A6EAY0_9PEZI|nr:hypothetical protein K469DRAFT_111269 [Zopfia rhizophila CBS 207.26]
MLALSFCSVMRIRRLTASSCALNLIRSIPGECKRFDYIRSRMSALCFSIMSALYFGNLAFGLPIIKLPRSPGQFLF